MPRIAENVKKLLAHFEVNSDELGAAGYNSVWFSEDINEPYGPYVAGLARIITAEKMGLTEDPIRNDAAF